jgi:HEAT repeat protein
VTARTVGALLEGAREPGADASLGEALEVLLPIAGDRLVVPAIDALAGGYGGRLTDALRDYVTRHAAGHEEELGSMFAQADLDLALTLVRILAQLNTPLARETILRAVDSPHAVVRVEALSHGDGSAERLRIEMRALLEDPDPDVRLSALRAVRTRQIRAAGPYLVMRIKAPGFDKLPFEERRLALQALAALAPARAEQVLSELLGETRMLTVESHEETRALAAEMLGQVATTADSLSALSDASSSRWRYSERVRSTARRAREQAEVRLSQAPVAPAPGAPSAHPARSPIPFESGTPPRESGVPTPAARSGRGLLSAWKRK